jgi:hypothetical protein
MSLPKLSLAIYLHGGTFKITDDNNNTMFNTSETVKLSSSPNSYDLFLLESILDGVSAQLNIATGVIENEQDFVNLDVNGINKTNICMSSEDIINGQCKITRTSPTTSIFYIKSIIDGNYLNVNSNNILAKNSQSVPLQNSSTYWFSITKSSNNKYQIMSISNKTYLGKGNNDNLVTNGNPTYFNFQNIDPPESQNVIDTFNNMFVTNNFDICCDQTQPTSYSPEYGSCNYSGYYFYNNKYSNNCKNYMNTKCTTDTSNIMCVDFCNNDDKSINCDNITQKYCNTLGEDALKKDTCDCFWPTTYLDNYYNSMKETFPNFQFDRNVMCNHMKCSQMSSNSIRRNSYKSNPHCPDIKLCLNKISITNTGYLDFDKLKIRQDISNCFGGNTLDINTPSPPGNTPPSPPGNTPPSPPGNTPPSPPGNTPPSPPGNTPPSPPGNTPPDNDLIPGLKNEDLIKYSILVVIIFIILSGCCFLLMML